jgi:serine/threonine protein kinase
MNTTAARPPAQPGPAPADAVAALPGRRPSAAPGPVPARDESAEAGLDLDPQQVLAGHDALVVGMAFEDYTRRRALGEQVDPLEYAARYPRLAGRVLEALEFHLALDEDLAALDFDSLWPQPGSVFLDFLLGELLGIGAFSQVHLARQTALGDRPVAVKISWRGAAEACTLGRLSHPNVVPVYSVHRDPETHLLVVCMPYLGCATLADVIREAFRSGQPARARVFLDTARRPLPSGEPAPPVPNLAPPDGVLLHGGYLDGALHLAVQLAEALAFVHAKGVLHRDIKPSNVLLGPDGRPRLLDFNLSADVQAAYARLGGTPHYASPEHLRALDPAALSAAGLDARSDVFSLGVVLYELLTGHHPFGPPPAGPDREAVRRALLARLGGGHEPLARANPWVDADLAAVVERCLAADPAARYQTAAGLSAALRRCQARRRRARRGRRTVAVLAAALLGLAVTGVVGAGVLPPLLDLVPGAVAAVQHNPDQPESWSARAAASQRLGETCTDPTEQVGYFTKAGDDFTRAWDASGHTDAKALVRAGYCYSLAEQHAPAIQAYQLALETDRRLDTAEINFDLALTLWRTGTPDNKKAARAALDHAVFLSGRLQRPFHLRAMIGLQDALNETNPVPERVTGDIERAIANGAPATDLYRDAAWIFAVAASRDATLTDRALDLVRKAVQAGQDPNWFADHPAFAALRKHEGFAAAVARANPHEPTRLPLYLDPFPEPKAQGDQPGAK